jgi:hypothetical protein
MLNMRRLSPSALPALLLATTALGLAAPAQAGGLAFDSHPNTNSVEWAAHLATLGAAPGLNIDFETHPLGPLQGEWYAAQGVHLALGGSGFSFNEVYDYRNNYVGTVSGYGPNSTAEGVAPESRAFSAYSANAAWTLTVTFDEAVLGAGLYVIDLFNGLGNRTTTLAAYSGVNGTGTLLATASAPAYNYQLYNQLFLGVASDSAVANIRSVVFTNPQPIYGDGIALDNLRIATTVPEPGPAALLLAGLGALGWLQRRRGAR